MRSRREYMYYVEGCKQGATRVATEFYFIPAHSSFEMLDKFRRMGNEPLGFHIIPWEPKGDYKQQIERTVEKIQVCRHCQALMPKSNDPEPWCSSCRQFQVRQPPACYYGEAFDVNTGKIVSFAGWAETMEEALMPAEQEFYNVAYAHTAAIGCMCNGKEMIFPYFWQNGHEDVVEKKLSELRICPQCCAMMEGRGDMCQTCKEEAGAKVGG